MKKKIILFAIALPLLWMSCSKDDNPLSNFKYGKEILGTWKITKAGPLPWSLEVTTITLNPDGTYETIGYFGDAKGTYTARDTKIEFSTDGKLLYTCDVLSLTGKTIVIEMTPDGRAKFQNTLTCEKQ